MRSSPKQDILVFDIKAASGGTSITARRNISGRKRRKGRRMGKQYVSFPKVDPTCSWRGGGAGEKKFMKMS